MQPVSEGRFGFADYGPDHEQDRSASWFAQAEAQSDRASRLGFVLTMLFFATAAIYGAFLSGSARSQLESFAQFTDSALAEAGFRIQDLALSGAKNVPSQTLFEALKLPHEGSILSYNTREARERLLQLGWIETAQVRRVLPSRLEIAITERAPAARWAAGNRIFVVDRDGTSLGPDEGNKFSNLLLVTGEGAQSEAAALSDALAPRADLCAKIEKAELVADRFWQVTLANGTIVKLPRMVSAHLLDRLETLLESPKVAELPLRVIDLRLTHRTVLQLRDATSANRDKAIAMLMGAPRPQPQAQVPARKGNAP